MRRQIIRACITIAMLALAYWTALAVTGHHVSPLVCVGPVLSVVCGLAYLRSERRS